MKENVIKIGRREFFANTGIAAAGVMIGSGILACSSQKEDELSSYDIMKEVFKYRKIDAHCHINDPNEIPTGPWFYPPNDELDKIADWLGIEKMIISRPITEGEANPGEFQRANNLVIKAVKEYPDRFIGQFTLNPQYQMESLEEINRCVDMGLVGLKVFNQVKINDPLFYPIIERCIDLKMIILMHSEARIGVGGYRMKYDAALPPESSIPEDFAAAARRYPEAMFQYAHIGGSSDYEYVGKALRDSSNVWVDVSGSNNEAGLIDFALEYIGEDRLLFGTDGSYYQSIGRMLSSDLNEQQKKKVFFDNYNKILRKAGRHVS